MSLKITAAEFTLIRNFIAEESGIYLAEDKTYLLENRLAGIVHEEGCISYFEFYMKLKASRHGRLVGAMINAITTNETYWFRELRAFRILREYLLPKFYCELQDGKRKQIRIWCAACSTGQEPYSIAMTILDFFRPYGGDKACQEQIRILATDISEMAVSMAQRGVYDKSQMSRGLPEEYWPRYFKKNSDQWQVSDSVRQLVEVRHHNLRNSLNDGSTFDLIFLRNVIIYFSDSFKQDLFRRLCRLMAPGGYLFLGNGENLNVYSNAFEAVETQGVIYYQVKGH